MNVMQSKFVPEINSVKHSNSCIKKCELMNIKNVFHAHALFLYMLVIFKAEDFGWHFHLFSLSSKIVPFKNEYH